MSNTTANAVDVSETPVDMQSSTNKNMSYRITAILFAVIGIVSLFIPLTYVMYGNIAKRTSFFMSFIGLFTGEETSYLFGFLPTHAPILQDALVEIDNIRGIVTAIIYYVFIILILTASAIGIVTFFRPQKAPRLLNITVFIFLFAYSMYALWHEVFVLTIDKKILIDFVCIFGTAVFFATSLYLAFNRRGKKAGFSVLQFCLSLVVSSILILAMEADTEFFKNAFASFGVKKTLLQDLIIYGLVTLSAINILCAYIRIQVKKGIPFEIVRYVLQIAILVFAFYIEFKFNPNKNKPFAFFCILAVVISIVQIILAIMQCNKIAKAKKQEKKESNMAEAIVHEYYAEEQVEPVPYEGGPINGVTTAELVEEEPDEDNKNEKSANAPAETKNNEEDSTYDFYNSKSFDPFIATLNKEERVEFTDLFVLRCKGDMPEIPEYVVGEPKKEFFNKIFVSLGKYRDTISDELLSKIYEFSLKLKK